MKETLPICPFCRSCGGAVGEPAAAKCPHCDRTDLAHISGGVCSNAPATAELTREEVETLFGATPIDALTARFWEPEKRRLLAHDAALRASRDAAELLVDALDAEIAALRRAAERTVYALTDAYTHSSTLCSVDAWYRHARDVAAAQAAVLASVAAQKEGK